MAQKVDNYQVKKAYDPEMITDEGAVETEQEKTGLKSPEMEKLHQRLMDWWNQERQYQADDRRQRELDHEYLDGHQWSEEERYEIEEVRGQPALVFNQMAPTIRWITGTEKRTRVDFKVQPRGEEDLKPAESKTKLLKYVGDVNRRGFHQSKAFSDAVVSGLGWLEDGIRSDPTKEKLFVRYQDWRYMWHDHLSVEPDMSDARFVFRGKWLDLDVALALFPEQTNMLKAQAESLSRVDGMDADDLYNPYLYSSDGRFDRRLTISEDAWNVDNRRERVFILEAWYRDPIHGKIIRGFDGFTGGFNGAIFDDTDPVHQWAIENGYAGLHDAITMQVRYAYFTKDGLLAVGPTPYWHNKFPFTPVIGYREGATGRFYGAARGLRDPQDDLNKRRSKALHILSTNQIIMDEGAVDDVDELIDEASRPDGVIIKKAGKQLEIHSDKQLAQEHVSLMDQDAQYIQNVGGVTDENMGRATNATSGRAIEARQNQGMTTTADLFDNLRLALQISGEKELALTEQFYDEKKTVRITGSGGKPEFHQINAPDPETGEMNQITMSQADFVVDEEAYRDSVRQMMFETLLDMVSKMPPEIGLRLLDLVVEMSDVPQRDAIVARIRMINGMPDPDEEKTEEQIIAEQRQAQKDAMFEERTKLAQLGELEGKAKKALAEGDLASQKAIKEKLGGMQSAFELAGGVDAMPHLGQIADFILQDAMPQHPGATVAEPQQQPVAEG